MLFQLNTKEWPPVEDKKEEKMNTKYEDYFKAIMAKIFELLSRESIEGRLTDNCLVGKVAKIEIESGYEQSKSINEVAYKVAYDVLSAEYRAIKE